MLGLSCKIHEFYGLLFRLLTRGVGSLSRGRAFKDTGKGPPGLRVRDRCPPGTGPPMATSTGRGCACRGFIFLRVYEFVLWGQSASLNKSALCSRAFWRSGALRALGSRSSCSFSFVSLHILCWVSDVLLPRRHLRGRNHYMWWNSGGQGLALPDQSDSSCCHSFNDFLRCPCLTLVCDCCNDWLIVFSHRGDVVPPSWTA